VTVDDEVNTFNGPLLKASHPRLEGIRVGAIEPIGLDVPSGM
jgi:hypothetical protein